MGTFGALLRQELLGYPHRIQYCRLKGKGWGHVDVLRSDHLFSGEKVLPNASSTLFATASPRRRFLLRSMRKTSHQPGASVSSAFASPTMTSGIASASLFNNSGSIDPSILLIIMTLRMPRIASGVLAASTTISRILLPPSSTPRSISRTPWSCSACSTSKPASNASACSAGAFSSREITSSRGLRLGKSRGIGLAIVLHPSFSILACATSPESARARCPASDNPHASTSAPPRRRAAVLDDQSDG